MAASGDITAAVDSLIELFNRRSVDLPDGLFGRQTQFVLNGVPFEERVSRSPSDPLVLMLTRGPAGYRFTAKAVQHAIPDCRLVRGELEEKIADSARVITAPCRLSGHFRADHEEVEILIDVTMRLHGPAAAQMTATLDERALTKLQEARLRP